MSQESNYVIELLNNSISPIESVRNEASNKIIQLELNSSFLANLLDIATSNNNELSKLSFIILKNSTCKIYSQSKINNNRNNIDYRNVLEHIKAKLLELLSSSFSKNSVLLSKDLCILVRRICRHEFPVNWPGLYENIVISLGVLSNQPEDVMSFNLVFLLHHIFKERLSMRLYRDRAVTNQLVELLFPYISKFWVQEFLGKWKRLELSEELFASFNDVQLSTSIYLDTLILNFYSDFLKNAFKSRDLLEVVVNLFYKFAILAKINSGNWERKSLVRKNILRIINGVARVIEKQPFTLVFVDFSLFLNQIFDFLVNSGWKEAEDACVKMLILIFSSNSMNNEKYVNIYFDQVENVPKVQTNLSPIISAKRKETIDVKTIVYYDSYESLVSSTSLSSQSEICDMMERQLTFCFYKLLSTRGGFVPFLDMLRTKYLKLDEESMRDWSEDEYPTESPSRNMVPSLVSLMKINLPEVFNYVFVAILRCEIGDFLNYDTYLQLYTLCFRDFYKFHSYKHFGAILDVFNRLLDYQKSEWSKLLIFRVSRIVNMWCKMPLIPQETKAQILAYLLKCVCSEGSESHKVQHLVPLHNLYTNTMDETMWTELFRSVKTDYLIGHLSTIVKVNVPVIRARNIELMCNICLEYEEDGRNLGLIVSIYDQLQSVEICEAIVRSVHDFISKLDWVNCYTNVDSLNKNFILFVLNIIKCTVVTDVSNGNYKQMSLTFRVGFRIVALSKYARMSELVLSMWLSFLRIVPFRFDEVLTQYFHIFGPLVDHLHENEEFREDSLYTRLCVDLLIEYLLLLVTHIERSRDYSIENSGKQVVFRSALTCFDLSKLYEICALLRESRALATVVYCAFGITPSVSDHCHSIINKFFGALEECAHSNQQSSCFSRLTSSEKSTSLQPMSLNRQLLENIVALLPVINKMMFTNQLVSNYIKQRSSHDRELWINEVLLTLINVSNALMSDPFTKLGCVALSCCIVSEFAESIYPFMRVEKKSEVSDPLDLGWDNINIHKNRQGIFIMCYLLRVLSSIARDYRTVYLAISNLDVEKNSIPPSNRFEYVKNKSLTNSTCLEHKELFGDSLSLVVRYVVEATGKMPEGFRWLLMTEIDSLNSQIAQVLRSL